MVTAETVLKTDTRRPVIEKKTELFYELVILNKCIQFNLKRENICIFNELTILNEFVRFCREKKHYVFQNVK